MPAAHRRIGRRRRSLRGGRGDGSGGHDHVPAGRESATAVGGAIGEHPAEVESRISSRAASTWSAEKCRDAIAYGVSRCFASTVVAAFVAGVGVEAARSG